jgi:hypothetical protein
MVHFLSPAQRTTFLFSLIDCESGLFYQLSKRAKHWIKLAAMKCQKGTHKQRAKTRFVDGPRAESWQFRDEFHRIQHFILKPPIYSVPGSGGFGCNNVRAHRA